MCLFGPNQVEVGDFYLKKNVLFQGLFVVKKKQMFKKTTAPFLQTFTWEELPIL